MSVRFDADSPTDSWYHDVLLRASSAHWRLMLSLGCFGSTIVFLRSRLIDRRPVLKNRVHRQLAGLCVQLLDLGLMSGIASSHLAREDVR
jgi:hypothetical protein